MRWIRIFLAAAFIMATCTWSYWNGIAEIHLLVLLLVLVALSTLLFSNKALAVYWAGVTAAYTFLRASPSRLFRILQIRTFGLRTLLLVILLVGIGASGVARYMRDLEEQRRFIQMIERLNGAVDVSCHWPRWLQSLIGEHRVVGALSIDFANARGIREIRDSDIARLAQESTAQRIIWLDLHHSGITNEGLLHVGRLSRLTHLNLSGCHIDDDGLKALHGSRDLKSVVLPGTQVSAQGVRDLNRALPGDPILVVSFEWRR